MAVVYGVKVEHFTLYCTADKNTFVNDRGGAEEVNQLNNCGKHIT